MNTEYHRMVSMVTGREIDLAVDGACKHIVKAFRNMQHRLCNHSGGLLPSLESREFRDALAATRMSGHMVGESDSFGPVVRYLECDCCYQKTQDLVMEEVVVCDDCSGEFMRKETTEWRWWDFNAAQGDEGYVLCKRCKCGEKHLARVRADRLDYEREFDDL